jgi:hypothetical protein
MCCSVATSVATMQHFCNVEHQYAISKSVCRKVIAEFYCNILELKPTHVYVLINHLTTTKTSPRQKNTSLLPKCIPKTTFGTHISQTNINIRGRMAIFTKVLWSKLVYTKCFSIFLTFDLIFKVPHPKNYLLRKFRLE